MHAPRKAVMAPTFTAENMPARADIGKTGLIASHGYTVLAVQNIGKTNATVTLRNPWGKDNSLRTSQYNDGFSANSRFEGSAVNNVKHDGIIRITWKDFEKFFQGYRTSAV